jgi:hypothetical protein
MSTQGAAFSSGSGMQPYTGSQLEARIPYDSTEATELVVQLLRSDVVGQVANIKRAARCVIAHVLELANIGGARLQADGWPLLLGREHD